MYQGKTNVTLSNDLTHHHVRHQNLTPKWRFNQLSTNSQTVPIKRSRREEVRKRFYQNNIMLLTTASPPWGGCI